MRAAPVYAQSTAPRYTPAYPCLHCTLSDRKDDPRHKHAFCVVRCALYLDDRVYAVDANNGTVVWYSLLDAEHSTDDVGSPPSLNTNETVLYVGAGASMYALWAADGKQITN